MHELVPGDDEARANVPKDAGHKQNAINNGDRDNHGEAVPPGVHIHLQEPPNVKGRRPAARVVLESMECPDEVTDLSVGTRDVIEVLTQPH